MSELDEVFTEGLDVFGRFVKTCFAVFLAAFLEATALFRRGLTIFLIGDLNDAVDNFSGDKCLVSLLSYLLFLSVTCGKS